MTPPSTIAHYRIVSKLGEGGMGAVYRATDTKLNREVAIKVLPDSFAADPDRLARFSREAQVLASLNHPNIAAIYGVEERALVLELVEGPTLAGRIAQGPIPPSEALPLIHQLIDALEYAHEKGVVHRDLKPANVKITPDGRVKVLDFGLAKALGSDPEAADPRSSPTLTMSATTAGMIMGTAGYMAPEQARGQNVDKRADIWAFGAVVYEMLTGEQLFAGPTVSDSLAAVLTREPDWKRVPVEARKLVRLCLVKDAKLRLRDIGDGRIPLADGASYSAPPVAPPAKSSRLPWIVAAAGLCAALVAGLAWLRRPVEDARMVQLMALPPEKASLSNYPPMVSPDGRHIAFTAMTEGLMRIWLRDLDAAAPHPLPGSEDVRPTGGIFWSPDSRFLGFFAGGKLKRMDIAGGPAVAICDAENARGGSWSSRDVIVFTPTVSNRLLRVPAAGGSPEPVTELDPALSETTHRWPWFLPDGRHFLYLGRSLDAENSAIWVGDLDSKMRRPLVKAMSNAAYDPGGYVLFMRDQTLVGQPFDVSRLELSGDPFPVFQPVDYNTSPATIGSFSVSGTSVLAFYSGGGSENWRLTWHDRAGKPVGTVGQSGRMNRFSVSPDGRTVATDRADPRSAQDYQIWLDDAARGDESRFTVDARDVLDPIWSPDGRHILFSSRRPGHNRLLVKPANGAGKEDVLVESTALLSVTDWSRDGKYAIYQASRTSTKSDIWAIPNPLGPAADRKPFAVVQSEAIEREGRLSPDGKWLAYQSDENRGWEVYVRSFPENEGKWQVSTSGGSWPVWNRDGKELFYISADRKVMSVGVKSGGTFEFGSPKALFDYSGAASLAGTSPFDVSPDGKRFLLLDSADAAATPTLHVVLNWHAGLKK